MSITINDTRLTGDQRVITITPGDVVQFSGNIKNQNSLS